MVWKIAQWWVKYQLNCLDNPHALKTVTSHYNVVVGGGSKIVQVGMVGVVVEQCLSLK